MVSLIWTACLLAIPQVMAGGQVPSGRLAMSATPVKPLIQGPAQYIAEIVSPDYTRDSCCSTRVGDRSLWVCRDSAAIGGSYITFQSTAGWSSLNADGSPLIQNGQLLVTPKNTQAFYPPALNECGAGNPAGFCGPGQGRWPIWPDSPPLPVTGLDGSVTLYTWIRQVHFPDASQLGSDTGQFPGISLYRSLYSGQPGDALPPTELLAQNFYPTNSVPFGQYGWVLSPDGYAYLYGQGRFGTMVARVAPSRIEDLGAYEYWANNAWGPQVPGPEAINSLVFNAGNGQQGTFYYSAYYASYIWIGQDLPGLIGSPNLVYMTAPRPEGPWSLPTFLMTFPSGGPDFRGQYSFQAHPGMSENGGDGRDIYVSETVDMTTYYKNYLYRIQFQTL